MEKRAFQAIHPEKLTVKCLSAMHYVPKVLKLQVSKRRHSSFLYIAKGEYCYCFGKETLFCPAGSLIYLPRDASYSYQVLSGDTEAMQCELDFLEDGQPVAFGDRPIMASGIIPEKIEEIFRELILNHGGGSPFVAVAHLFHLLSFFDDGQTPHFPSSGWKKIQPAVAYIRRHYREKIPIAHLAEICYLSQSQLRRLFRAEMGQSPIEMKNQLLVKAACDMLRSTENSVSEIAEALGCESLYAFSRLFKQIQGVSPRTYAQKFCGK